MKWTDEDINKIQDNVIATLEVEGLRPSKQAININSLYLKGYIGSETAIEQIIKFHLGNWK